MPEQNKSAKASVSEVLPESEADRRLFYWKAASFALGIGLCGVSGLFFAMHRDISPLAAVSRITTQETCDFLQASSQLRGSDLTLIQVISGMYMLGGDPLLLLNTEQSRRTASIMPLICQFVDEGKAGKSTLESAAASSAKSRADYDNMPLMLKRYLWTLLSTEQKRCIADMSAAGRLDVSADEVMAFLPAFYESVCQNGGISDKYGSYAYSPVRVRVNKLRLMHWIIGLVLLESSASGTLSDEQIISLNSMEKLISDSSVLVSGSEAFYYLPVLEAQIRAVVTDAQQERLLKLLEAYDVFNLNVDVPNVINNFHVMLAKRMAGSVFDVEPGQVLRVAGNESQAPVTARIATDLPVIQMIVGIMIVLEPDAELRLSDSQFKKFYDIRDGVEACLDRSGSGRHFDVFPKVQSEIMSILTDRQVEAIRSSLPEFVKANFTVDTDEVARREFKKFLRCRMEKRTYKPEA